jgi:hypothetical protein
MHWPFACPGHWECPKGVCRPMCDFPLCREDIPFHQVVTDGTGRILPWKPFGPLLATVMGFIGTCPRDPLTALPWYMQYSAFRFESMRPKAWPHNPAGLFGMMVETILRYWPYTGEKKWVEMARRPLDHLIANSTPSSYLWPRVPYASADNTGRYAGGSHEGIDGIEPDKVGQAAVGYVRFFKLTGETNYLEEARHCAGVLADRIRPADEFRSPWPFRVNARTGEILEEYTSDVLWPIVLFEELGALGVATPAMNEARDRALSWMMRYPMQNMRWKGYFEDVELDPLDLNREQYTPGEVARYLMRHPETDPEWRHHVASLLSWIKSALGDTSPLWRGATAVREQLFWQQIAGSHTARYASLCAMWYAASGQESFREEALRTFALASYFARDDGIVIFSICDQDVWFSDGYFDYVPHFIDGMAALPEMAPDGETHLLGSTSVVTDISYGPSSIAYRTFETDGEDILKLGFVPERVSTEKGSLDLKVDEDGIPGYTFDPVRKVLRIHRRGASSVVVSGAGGEHPKRPQTSVSCQPDDERVDTFLERP